MAAVPTSHWSAAASSPMGLPATQRNKKSYGPAIATAFIVASLVLGAWAVGHTGLLRSANLVDDAHVGDCIMLAAKNPNAAAQLQDPGELDTGKSHTVKCGTTNRNYVFAKVNLNTSSASAEDLCRLALVPQLEKAEAVTGPAPQSGAITNGSGRALCVAVPG